MPLPLAQDVDGGIAPSSIIKKDSANGVTESRCHAKRVRAYSYTERLVRGRKEQGGSWSSTRTQNGGYDWRERRDGGGNLGHANSQEKRGNVVEKGNGSFTLLSNVGFGHRHHLDNRASDRLHG